MSRQKDNPRMIFRFYSVLFLACAGFWLLVYFTRAGDNRAMKLLSLGIVNFVVGALVFIWNETRKL